MTADPGISVNPLGLTVMASRGCCPETDHCTEPTGSISEPHESKEEAPHVRSRSPPVLDPETAFVRGEKLIKNEGAPAGASGLQFYPSRDGGEAVCLSTARPSNRSRSTLTRPSETPARTVASKSPPSRRSPTGRRIFRSRRQSTRSQLCVGRAFPTGDALPLAHNLPCLTVRASPEHLACQRSAGTV